MQARRCRQVNMVEENNNSNNNNSEQSNGNEYEEKVRKIADHVWKLWQKDLRNERERRGKNRR
jgi:hypothetical protein